MINCLINNDLYSLDPTKYKNIRLIDFLRTELGLIGTKEGCGEGECGACTILIGELNKHNKLSYRACASCLMLVGEMNGKHIVTIEGVTSRDDNGNVVLNMIQKIMTDNLSSQCGFCTPGIIMSIIGYLLKTNNFSIDDMINALDGNICRCTGYVSIKNAVSDIINNINDNYDYNLSSEKKLEYFVDKNILPQYFLTVQEKLTKINSDCCSSLDYKEESILIAGGTDVCIQKSDILDNINLIFLSKRDDLGNSIYLDNDKNCITVEANVKIEDFRNSKIINKYFPSINKNLLFFASTILRNNATLVGNLVNASPIGDLSIILLALNASVIVKKIQDIDNKNIREIKLTNFFKSYKITELNKCEIIKEIHIPIPGNDINYKYNFEKVSTRKYLDIASCSSAMYIEFDNNYNKLINVSISAGGVASIPFFLSKTSNFLKNSDSEISEALILNALDIIDDEIKPRGSELRGSSEYKKLLLKQLIKIHFNKFFPDKFNFSN